jgi:GTP-binding protein
LTGIVYPEADIRRFLGLPIAFERGVTRMDDLPDADRPEVAFAGRSNVGKSSLVNGALNRTHLARASSEPGRTRELNFFKVAEIVRIVDLPGYGYAKAPKTEIERWTRLTRDYLRGRPGLARVFLLIDGRHGLKEPDLAVMKTLDEAAVVYQIVLTKTDKPKTTELEALIAKTAAAISRRPAAHPIILACSAHEGFGLDALRSEIMALAGVPMPEGDEVN